MSKGIQLVISGTEIQMQAVRFKSLELVPFLVVSLLYLLLLNLLSLAHAQSLAKGRLFFFFLTFFLKKLEYNCFTMVVSFCFITK